jgi:N12 class adenine-specific DNA methylase
MDENDFKNLEHQVGQHEAELEAISKRVEELEDALKIALRETNILDRVRVRLAEVGPQSVDSGWEPKATDLRLIEKWKRFLEKFGS